ncbi:MAG TPA: 16S rRNA (cytosine(1402)-N(4))-methyltransferase RsmH [Candidatus Acidoferrum sp.]|jgi:16S rRNA (cytosine1402-N4)-methyltransferase
MESSAPHTPVMLQEVLEWLRIRPDGIYVDATLGAGGHSEAIAERISSGSIPGRPAGRLISLDRDEQALRIARERLKTFGSKVSCVLSPFSRIAEVVHELGIQKVDGVLADLGVSSMQLDQAERGFSFREAGPLSMRMGISAEDEQLTAEEIVNRWPEKELADLLYREADEHDSRRIARAIVRARPIRDTAHLATVVAGSRAQWGRQRLHPATKTFLALRIAVNREMEELGQFLSRVPATMNPEGRCVMLTYHSREDRIVKEAFREAAKRGTLKILTKHVVRPSEEEQRMNPRSRSAKLRCAEAIA